MLFSEIVLQVFLLILFSFQSIPLFGKEYLSLSIYLKEFPAKKPTGNDGNWILSDREKRSEVWNQANLINIQKLNGYLEYQTIAQRCAFYKWFQQKTDSLGYETKWAGMACVTTKKLEKLLSPICIKAGISNKEIQEMIIAGNEAIFNDIWDNLNQLYGNKPLKNKEAKKWDGNLLFKEQDVIDPYFRKLSKKSINKLEKCLARENLASKFIPGLEFEGSLLKESDRWFYGMKLMGYTNDDLNDFQYFK